MTLEDVREEIEDARNAPKPGDTWETGNGLIRLRVTRGRLPGFVRYRRRFGSDPSKSYSCPLDMWAAKVRGMRYRGRA